MVNFWDSFFGMSEERRRKSLKRFLPDLHKDQKHKCMYCGTKIREGDGEVDHKKAFSRNGSDQYRNLQLLCGQCNRRKGDLSDVQFRRRFKAILPEKLPPSKEIPLAKFQEVAKGVATRKAKAARKRREDDPFGIGW